MKYLKKMLLETNWNYLNFTSFLKTNTKLSGLVLEVFFQYTEFFLKYASGNLFSNISILIFQKPYHFFFFLINYNIKVTTTHFTYSAKIILTCTQLKTYWCHFCCVFNITKNCNLYVNPNKHLKKIVKRLDAVLLCD